MSLLFSGYSCNVVSPKSYVHTFYDTCARTSNVTDNDRVSNAFSYWVDAQFAVDKIQLSKGNTINIILHSWSFPT